MCVLYIYRSGWREYYCCYHDHHFMTDARPAPKNTSPIHGVDGDV